VLPHFRPLLCQGVRNQALAGLDFIESAELGSSKIPGTANRMVSGSLPRCAGPHARSSQGERKRAHLGDAVALPKSGLLGRQTGYKRIGCARHFDSSHHAVIPRLSPTRKPYKHFFWSTQNWTRQIASDCEPQRPVRLLRERSRQGRSTCSASRGHRFELAAVAA
jgi:hypothetical protein